MKQTLFVFLFGILLIAFFVPNLALAQDVPQQCCKINQNVRLSASENWLAGTCVGAPGAGGDACKCAPGGPGAANETEKWGLVCALNVLYTITNWIFIVMVALAVFLTIQGAWDIMWASSPDNTAAGRNKIIVAAAGLAAGILARAVPSAVRYFVGAA